MKRKLKLTIMALMVAGIAVAQKPNAEERVEKRLERIDNTVSLSELQKQELKPILMAGAEEIKILRQSGEMSKEKAKEIRKAQKEAIASVLTEDQVAKMEEAKAEKKADKMQARKEIRSYNKEHVKPVLLEKRQAFESLLSAQEKEVISKAREMKPKRKGKKGSLTQAEKEEMKAQRDQISLMLKPIKEAHATDLAQVKVEMEATMQAAKEHAKDLKSDNEGKGQKSKKKKKKRKDNFEDRFLLMKI